MVEFYDVAMRAITERSVRRLLAVAQLVVSALAHVELHRSAASHTTVAGIVAARVSQTHSACAPAVDLALLQVGVVGEETCILSFIPVR